MCLGAIYWSRIQKAIFGATRYDVSEIAGFNDELYYNEIDLPWEERKIEYEKASSPEIINLLRECKEKPNKQEY